MQQEHVFDWNVFVFDFVRLARQNPNLRYPKWKDEDVKSGYEIKHWVYLPLGIIKTGTPLDFYANPDISLQNMALTSSRKPRLLDYIILKIFPYDANNISINSSRISTYSWQSEESGPDESEYTNNDFGNPVFRWEITITNSRKCNLKQTINSNLCKLWPWGTIALKGCLHSTSMEEDNSRRMAVFRLFRSIDLPVLFWAKITFVVLKISLFH